MPTLTVRNLDPQVTDALKALGAEHGRSMEAEARLILAHAVQPRPSGAAGGLGSQIRARFIGLDWDSGTRPGDAARAADFGA
jgi:plasmid stability protein